MVGQKGMMTVILVKMRVQQFIVGGIVPKGQGGWRGTCQLQQNWGDCSNLLWYLWVNCSN